MRVRADITTEFIEKASAASELVYLTDYSPADKPWDTHRGQCEDVTTIYAIAVEFERYATNMADCSGLLRFGWIASQATGEIRFRLREARFCRLRYCPVCQWRRSLMWLARFYKSLPNIVAAHPTARWLFLTLTVRNCSIQQLGKTLTAMNVAWHRLIKRDAMKPIKGWIRTTEVTRGSDGSAHPHFHVLLMVPSHWFGKNYVTHQTWIELWRESLRLDYDPNVDIRTVKSKGKVEAESSLFSLTQALQDAVAETLKYSTKPDDMTADPEWFLELTRQTRKRRFIATGGVLKNILREGEESNEDLIEGDNEGDGKDDGVRLAFGWKKKERRYRCKPKQDVQNPV